MRGTLKTSTLESKFPLLRVENNCIISKFADITAAYRVTLPELFTLTGEEYEALHGAWLKALKVLPDYTVVHKQDFFIEERYTAPEEGSERSFLARSYERHFNERPYLRHTCYLFVTKTTPERMRQTSASSVLCRGFIVPREMRDTDAVTRFLEAAEALRYDIGLLEQRFGVGFETVCHRLSTLQRPAARGVPFFFIRVDRAGNISKRQSATDFHFSRIGGTCPLWNVYEAFTVPGRILTQLAAMPDGRRYLWVARSVAREAGAYGAPGKTFSIGLGCDLRHADRLVYSRGLDLSNPEVATPIGAGCKVCERQDCPQRAFPPMGRSLSIDADRRYFEPYRHGSREPAGAGPQD